MRTFGVPAAAVGLLAVGLLGCAQNDVDSAGGHPLVTVRVRLVQVGGPMPGTAERPVAYGWIQAQPEEGERSTVRTNAVGLANIELPPGTYTFAGRETQSAGFYCRARRPVTLRRGSEAPDPPIIVTCVVP